MADHAYRVLHMVISRALKIGFRMTIVGLEHIPKDQPVILAANHQAMLDSIAILAMLPADNKAKFMAKKEYFDRSSLRGRLVAWFVGQSAIPVDRSDSQAGKAAIDSLVRAVRAGESVAVHPEGTRVPEQCVYRGKTGVIDVAWQTGAPVVPIGIRGTRQANPPYRRLPRLGREITLVIGKPLTFQSADSRSRLLGGKTALKRKQLRQLMETIAQLADMPYVHKSPPK